MIIFKDPFQPKLICDAMIQTARVTMFKKFKFRPQSSESNKKAELYKSKKQKSVQVALTSLRNGKI